MRRAAAALVALLALAGAHEAHAGGVRRITIHYLAHGGYRRAAVVLLPRWYSPRNNPRIPLVISPHGRGLTGRRNARVWGSLPTQGGFAVVNPDGQGRSLSRLSWGYPQQIHDLARMPGILRRQLPWLRIDLRRIYAVGGSMGGQETLLLLARHPALLAGAVAFDSVTDFALQYRNFRRLRCRGACVRAWEGRLGDGLQLLARREVGGTPWSVPGKFAARSPLNFAHLIAHACVPLQLWWSARDRIVTDQAQQSARLFRRVRQLNRAAPVEAFVGTWTHSREMRASTRLPIALQELGLLPKVRPIVGVRVIPPPERTCGRRHVTSAT